TVVVIPYCFAGVVDPGDKSGIERARHVNLGENAAAPDEAVDHAVSREPEVADDRTRVVDGKHIRVGRSRKVEAGEHILSPAGKDRNGDAAGQQGQDEATSSHGKTAGQKRFRIDEARI